MLHLQNMWILQTFHSIHYAIKSILFNAIRNLSNLSIHTSAPHAVVVIGVSVNIAHCNQQHYYSIGTTESHVRVHTSSTLIMWLSAVYNVESRLYRSVKLQIPPMYTRQYEFDHMYSVNNWTRPPVIDMDSSCPRWQREGESKLPTIESSYHSYQDEGNEQNGQRCPTMESWDLYGMGSQVSRSSHQHMQHTHTYTHTHWQNSQLAQ